MIDNQGSIDALQCIFSHDYSKLKDKVTVASPPGWSTNEEAG